MNKKQAKYLTIAQIFERLSETNRQIASIERLAEIVASGDNKYKLELSEVSIYPVPEVEPLFSTTSFPFGPRLSAHELFNQFKKETDKKALQIDISINATLSILGVLLSEYQRAQNEQIEALKIFGVDFNLLNDANSSQP